MFFCCLIVLRPNEKLPVVVYIHGGAYSTLGSNLHDPNIFMDENIVFVTINSRLGPLGFLYLEKAGINGNMALKDQRMALEWVNRHIESFGGNKEKITLFGHSSGAAMVEMHMLTEESRSLFNQAIMMSGTAYAPWAFSRLNNTRMILKEYSNEKSISMDKAKMKNVKRWLMSMDVERLMRIAPFEPYISGISFKGITFPWGPIIEEQSSNDDFFKMNLQEYSKQSNEMNALYGFSNLVRIEINFI